jgi:hypothetical protein
MQNIKHKHEWQLQHQMTSLKLNAGLTTPEKA